MAVVLIYYFIFVISAIAFGLFVFKFFDIGLSFISDLIKNILK